MESLKQDSTKALYQRRMAEKIINNPITNEDDVDETWEKIKKKKTNKAKQAKSISTVEKT